MAKEQAQVNINDEVGAVRILSVIFITFMVLIVGSYSDMPQNSSVQNTPEQSLTSEQNHNISPSNQAVSVAFNLSQK